MQPEARAKQGLENTPFLTTPHFSYVDFTDPLQVGLWHVFLITLCPFLLFTDLLTYQSFITHKGKEEYPWLTKALRKYMVISLL